MKIRVNLPKHPYDIMIEHGALAQMGIWTAKLWRPQKIVLMTDSTVGELYGEKVASRLKSAGFEVSIFTFPAGEGSKVLTTAEKAWNFCAEIGLTRSDGIIGFGGGVVGDLAGFVASTYMRGIHFLQIATSLTAQVDSSVGGKTGINSNFSKNMIGTFAQPDGVLIDPDVLTTLDRRCLIEGMGEVIKCGLIGDLVLWNFLVELKSANDILPNADFIIAHAIEVKRKVVVEDELDKGTRLKLNFGHTIGHAIEVVSLKQGDSKLMHGEAVAIGMVQISKVAEEKGLMPTGITTQIREMCRKFDLPVAYEPWQPAPLYQALTHDKKARGKMIKTVLVPEIGQAEIKETPIEKMREWLEK